MEIVCCFYRHLSVKCKLCKWRILWNSTKKKEREKEKKKLNDLHMSNQRNSWCVLVCARLVHCFNLKLAPMDLSKAKFKCMSVDLKLALKLLVSNVQCRFSSRLFAMQLPWNGWFFVVVPIVLWFFLQPLACTPLTYAATVAFIDVVVVVVVVVFAVVVISIIAFSCVRRTSTCKK